LAQLFPAFPAAFAEEPQLPLLAEAPLALAALAFDGLPHLPVEQPPALEAAPGVGGAAAKLDLSPQVPVLHPSVATPLGVKTSDLEGLPHFPSGQSEVAPGDFTAALNGSPELKVGEEKFDPIRRLQEPSLQSYPAGAPARAVEESRKNAERRIVIFIRILSPEPADNTTRQGPREKWP